VGMKPLGKLVLRPFLTILVLCGVLLAPAGPRAEEGEAARAQRWHDLAQAIFGERQIQEGTGIIVLDAPVRALDAALVPVTITLSGAEPIRAIYLVIDENPSPLAAHVVFGPAADPHSLRLRVRVDQYTEVHAVAESAAGVLYETKRFVKAAGGCSAPAGSDDPAALKDIGHMKLRLVGGVVFGRPVEAQLLIRHPNFNGMQMNQLTRQITPAHFIQSVDVSYQGQLVFHLDGDISMSSDPVIGFGFVPKDRDRMKVVVRDSKNAIFEHSFHIPPEGS
jgi:sulfur-oxidizing protein SoxY